jgi:hypothetical protein
MPQVNHPKYGIINFPDNMSQEDIRQALIKLDQQGNKIIQPTQQKLMQQQPVAPKPVVKQEEEQTFYNQLTNKVSQGIKGVTNFFTGEEEQTPQQKISNQIPNVNQSKSVKGYGQSNIETPKPINTNAKASELANVGYRQGSSFEEQKSVIDDNYNKESEKVKNNYLALLRMAGEENPSLDQLPPNIKLLYNKDLQPITAKYNAEINKLKAQPLTNRKGLITDINQKNKRIEQLNEGIDSYTKKVENLSKQNEFLNLAKENNPLNKPSSIIPIVGIYNIYDTYSKRKAEINKAKKQLEGGKKDLQNLKNFNIDPIQILKNTPANELPQITASLEKPIKNLLESAKKFINLEDETTIRDLNKEQETNKIWTGNVIFDWFTNNVVKRERDVVKVKNYLSDTNAKGALENTTNYYYDKVEFSNAGSKNRLQQKIVEKGWDKDINAFDEKFNALLEDFPSLKNDSNKLMGTIQNLYSTPEQQQKVLSLIQDPDFQEIVTNNEALYNLNGARIGQSLKMFQAEKINELQALKVVKNLNERQQAAQDKLELRSKESGLFSADRVNYYLQQLDKGKSYIAEYGKQQVGSLATTINPESESARKLEYSADLWKAINFAQDEGNISLFDKGVEWVNLEADKNNNYQIGFNKLGQVVDVKANDMSISVKGSQRDLIENYFYSNSSELKKQAGDIYSMPGGTSAALGGTSKAIAVGIAEEAPTIAAEVAATIFTEGAAAPLLEATLLRLGAKGITAAKASRNFSKIAGQVINTTSTYAEVKHDVEKNYKEQGLDPGLLQVITTSGAISAVSQLTPGLENKYRQIGADFVADRVKKEANNVFVEDIPKVIKSLTDDLVDIKNPSVKDYLFNKELRNYAVARFSDRMGTVAKSFRKEGLQEASEETILEPLAQVLANAANASLTGNEEYNKETLRDLGFLDPETALIAGLTGGIMSSGIEVSKASSDLNETLAANFKKDNGLNTINALQAAIKDPNKFKSLLSTFIGNSSPSGNSLTQETYNNLIESFDTVKNNFEQTKKDFNLDNDFISKLDFENPLHKSILESVGVNLKNIESFNGSKTFDNVILNSELNKVNKEKVVASLAQSLGIPNNNNQLDLTPYLDENGFFDYNKYIEIIGKDTLDEITINNIKEYNNIVGREKSTKNLINLFNKNLGPIQSQFKAQYQTAIENNPELLNPQAGFVRSIYQQNLFNKLANQTRIDRINSLLEIGQAIDKDKELREELKTLNENNKSLDKSLTSITDTYTNGYFDAQENLNNLDEEFNEIDKQLQDKLNSYLSPGLIDNLSEEKENEIKNLIRIKSDKLKEIKKTHKEFNSRFNNGLKSQTLNRKALITDAEGKRTVKDVTIDKQLEESIKGDKERLTKIKEYRKIFANLINGQATKQDLDKLKKNNRLYNKQLLEETVLPYYVSFNKEELIQAFDNDPDLLLGMFSILEDMGYVGDIQNYKNVNLDTLTSVVTDGIIKLNYNISLINNNQENLINNFDQKNGALLVNNYIKTIEENSAKNQEQPAVETPTQSSDNVQDNVISLIEKNSKLKSDFDEDEITNNFYIINDKEYKRVTSVERDELNSNENLTAGANVGNFFDSLGRFIFGNLNVTKENSDVILQAQLDYFKNNGITFNLKKDSYVEMFNNLIEQRDSLIQEGFKFITEERVLYHAYDGLKFIGEDSTGINDNTIGVAGTMDIIAVGKDGKVDIIDLKTISDNKGKDTENLKDKETNGWSKQLGFYKTLLEKIPSVKVNNTKVFVSKVKYDISDFGNTISFLNFIEPKLNTINISKSALTLINNYLSIPNLVIDKPVEIITNTEAITEEEMPDYILEQQMLLAEDSNPELPNNEDFGPDEFQLSQATGVPVTEMEGIVPIIKTEVIDLQTDNNIFFTPVNQTKAENLEIEINKLISDKNKELRNLIVNTENVDQKINKITNKYNKLITKAKKELLILQGKSPIQKTKLVNELVTGDKIIIDNKVVTVVSIYPGEYTDGNQSWFEGNETFKINIEREGITSGIFDNNEIFNPINSQNSDEYSNWEVNLVNDLENETTAEFEIEPTAEESARAKSVFGTKPVLDPVTQLITGQANQVNFETSSNNVLEGFEDEADSNIVSLTRVAYVKFNITYDEQNNKQYDVSIFNNQELNKKFNNKILTETEVEKLFKDNGLFFSNKIESNNVYVLKDINKKPINSFQQENIISKITIPESSILNSIYANDLTNQEGEIVVLDTENKYNNTLKTEKDFRNNAALGVVVNNALVAIIPANKGNTRNAQVRNKLTITKVGNTFTVQPFKVKIKKVKKDAFLFNNQPIRINNFLNKVNGFKSTIAFVYEVDKVKKLVNPFVNREVSELNIPADNLTNNGVFLILEKSGENPIIIPLQTPKLREFFEGTQEDLENIKTILKTSISDVFTSQDLQGNYNVFLNRLRTASDKNPIISQIFKIIPTSINETSTNTSQKIKLENLKLNFNLDNIMDYLWDTLITLNENTRDFYSVDLDPENFYANNSVIIDYDKNIIMDTKNNDITSNSIFNQDNDVYC